QYNINRFSKLLSNMEINNYNIAIQGKLFTITLNEKEINILKAEEKLNANQIKWMIRGTYLGAGSINNPQKKYHLEIGITQKQDAEKIVDYLKSFEIKSNIIEKNNQYAI